jgi:membrane protein DedA with SNARE-associated domain
MRLAVFTVFNFLTALLFGTYAYSLGYSAGMIAVFVISVLVVLQFAYVTWLVVIAALTDRGASSSAANSEETVLPSGTRSTLTNSSSRTESSAR